MHKFVLDIRDAINNCYLNIYQFYDKTGIMDVLRHYFRLVSISGPSNDSLELIFEQPYGSNESGIPERVRVIQFFYTELELSHFVSSICLNMKIDNPMVMETIINFNILKFKSYNCLINEENMKLIMKSTYLTKCCVTLVQISVVIRSKFIHCLML